MEQSASFQSIVRQIKAIEQRSQKYSGISLELDKCGENVEKEIEDHFAKCINALATRKATLLSECTLAIQNHRKQIDEAQQKLKDSLGGCTQVLNGGVSLYGIDVASAEKVWESLKNLPIPDIPSLCMQAELPLSLVEAIQTHGNISTRDKPIESTRPPLKVSQSNIPLLAGMVSTLASPTKAIRLEQISGMCLNPVDNCLYVCDIGSIKKVSPQGEAGMFVDSIQLKSTSYGLAINTKTKDFFVASGNAIEKISLGGTISRFVGNDKPGHIDGIGTSASFNKVCGLVIDQSTGNIFVTDWENHAIRKISPDREVSTLAGGTRGYNDGVGVKAQFYGPGGIAFDENGQFLLVCDHYNHKLRKVSLTGEVVTVCAIQNPSFVAITRRSVLVSSSSANKIYSVTQKGRANELAVFAGSGKAEYKDGKPEECGFYCPKGIAVDEVSHSCFVADTHNHAIRRISFC